MVLDGGNRDYKSLSWRLCVCVCGVHGISKVSLSPFSFIPCGVVPLFRGPVYQRYRCVCVYKMVEVTFVFSSENYVKVRLIVYAVTKMMWRGGGFWDIKSERK